MPPLPREKRPVSNDELTAALGLSENKRLAHTLFYRFKFVKDLDVRDEVFRLAVWRALQYHQSTYEGRQRKFVTSLAKFIHWECQRYERRVKREQRRLGILKDHFFVHHNPDHVFVVDELEHYDLNVDPTGILKERFLDEKTLTEIAREKGWSENRTRKQVRAAIDELTMRRNNL